MKEAGRPPLRRGKTSALFGGVAIINLASRDGELGLECPGRLSPVPDYPT